MASEYLKIERVEFTVTGHCSGNCLHCSVGGRQRGRMHHVPEAESVALLRRVGEIWPLRSVMTFGGEPLLYPEVTCALHRAAAEAGARARQLITNGFFSRDPARVAQVARMLADAGVNDVLLSVDAFHQATIPLEAVRGFARAVKATGMPLRLQPAWVVRRGHDNPWNRQTEAILSDLADLDLPVGEGNDIFLSGRAAEHLAAYYPPREADFTPACGRAPYTDPLTAVRSLSVEPDGTVRACAIPIGNLRREPIEAILMGYDPHAHPVCRALLDGPEALLALAHERGISTRGCYTACDLCRRLNP